MAPLLELRGVALRAGEREVLRDVSLSVREGERLVLLGVNGKAVLKHVDPAKVTMVAAGRGLSEMILAEDL